MPTYGLLDVNNFYASCETVFNPKLKDKSLVILSNNDGCAVSRSNAAKALGIKMGAPWFQINAQHPGKVQALSSNYALYADLSNRVMELICHFTPDYEVYSIDEAFLLLDGFKSSRLNNGLPNFESHGFTMDRLTGLRRDCQHQNACQDC